MNIEDLKEVWAVPGESNVVDFILPDTGLTLTNNNDAAAVLAKYPDAQRMTYDNWKAAAAARQNTAIMWLLTTPEKYDEMLNVLPPAFWRGGLFLVGEPTDHSFSTGQPRFSGYWQKGKTYLASDRPITITEAKAALA